MAGEVKEDRRKRYVMGYTIGQIAEMTGLTYIDVSMALSGKRLLRRNKLMQVYRAGFPLELFVFGKDFFEKEMKGEK